MTTKQCYISFSCVLFYVYRGDFKVQFEHVNMLDAVFKNDNVSVLRLFYHMTISMFKRSTRSNENNGKFIYHKILWSK